jgi:hypothetical protein
MRTSMKGTFESHLKRLDERNVTAVFAAAAIQIRFMMEDAAPQPFAKIGNGPERLSLTACKPFRASATRERCGWPVGQPPCREVSLAVTS